MAVKLKIANGKSEKSNLVKNVSLTWDELLVRLKDFRVQPKDRSYILTGQCPSGVRGGVKGDLISESHLLMIDLDNKGDIGEGLSWDELEFDLSMFLGDVSWAAYTTRSYNGSSVNFRIIVPFAKGLAASKHRSAVKHIMSLLPEKYTKWFDACSENVNQPIFLPCLKEDGAPSHFAHGGEEPIDFNTLDLVEELVIDESFDDLESLLSAQPLDLSSEQVSAYLDALDPNTLSYGSDEGVFGWADVGMAISHQYGGSDEGYNIWVNWSSRNTKKHNENGMKAKYKSFDKLPRNKKPITFASVIAEVKEKGGITALTADGGVQSRFEELMHEASEIDSVESYNAFKANILKMDNILVPDDARSMIAHEIAKGFGKESGMTKAVITKAITPTKKEAAILVDGGELPEWAKGWCYIEKLCQFYHIPTDHAIVKEAFNAKYDREIECILSDCSASHLVLVLKHLPTYADTMYYPGAGEILTDHMGREVVNAYIESGVKPSDTITTGGQKAIDKMLSHLNMLVPDKREQTIVLDWLTYVYQNPGKRINWALFIQGAQGTGKSYFSSMMGYLLGANSKTLEASAIAERFTSWAHGSRMTTIEEVRVSGTSKFSVMDRIKIFVTNDTIQIEEKGRDHRVVPNFTNYLMLSNHKDALPIDDGDRRYCAIFTDIQSEEELYKKLGGKEAAEEYFDELFGLTEEHASCIAAFFRDRKISDSFKPRGRAPETSAKAVMKALSVSNEHALLENALSYHECDVINDRIVDVTWLQKLVEIDPIELPQTRALSAVLIKLGYEPFEKRIYISKRKLRHSVWYRPNLFEKDKIEEFIKDFHDGNNHDDFEFASGNYDDSECPF